MHTSLALPNVREAMAVLDYGFHAMDSRFQVLDSSLEVEQTLVGFQIP